MRVTLEEIAKIAGVSKATVSRVLNNASEGVGKETREKVLRIIRQTNYTSALAHMPAARTMKSCSIALVIPDVANPFFADIAKSVEIHAGTKGYITILANTCFSEEREISYIKNLVAKKVDGIILVPTGMQCREEHRLPEKYGIPMIFLDRELKGDERRSGVFADNEAISFRCCEILIKNGSERIVLLSGPKGISTSGERMEGYKTALQQYRCTFDPRLVKYGDYTVESGYKAVVELEQAGECYSAIFAANDLMALGALNALREFSKKVPDDIELIGFDNIEFSKNFDPPLSTVLQPTTEMGIKAAEMLITLIDGKKLPENRIRIEPKIILRKTTRKGKIL